MPGAGVGCDSRGGRARRERRARFGFRDSGTPSFCVPCYLQVLFPGGITPPQRRRSHFHTHSASSKTCLVCPGPVLLFCSLLCRFALPRSHSPRCWRSPRSIASRARPLCRWHRLWLPLREFVLTEPASAVTLAAAPRPLERGCSERGSSLMRISVRRSVGHPPESQHQQRQPVTSGVYRARVSQAAASECG